MYFCTWPGLYQYCRPQAQHSLNLFLIFGGGWICPLSTQKISDCFFFVVWNTWMFLGCSMCQALDLSLKYPRYYIYQYFVLKCRCYKMISLYFLQIYFMKFSYLNILISFMIFDIWALSQWLQLKFFELLKLMNLSRSWIFNCWKIFEGHSNQVQAVFFYRQ